jgi:uncharacterized membrane protein YeaQ/YmgE (transglycosylase-associated protein family)
MTLPDLMIFLLIGAVAGWLGGRIMHGGLGLLGDIVVGVIGAEIGGWLFGVLGIAVGGLIGSIIAATVEARSSSLPLSGWSSGITTNPALGQELPGAAVDIDVKA